MSFDEAGTRQVLACASALAGVGGLLCVFAVSPRRTAPSSIALMCAFAALVAGGGFGVEAMPFADEVASRWMMAGGSGALVLGVLLMVTDARARERAMKLAQSESETRRREVERLGGTNVRLEDELQDVRTRLAMIEKSGGESELSRTARDATTMRQRKALELAVASERKHREIFEGAFEGMAMLERETLRLTTVNPSLVRMTGRDAEDLAQRTLMDLFAPGPSQPGKTDLLRSAREARPLNVEIQRKDGGVCFVDVSVTVIGTGEHAQLLTVVRDVSERRLLEQELQQHVATLKERERGLADANAQLGERAGRIEEMNERLRLLQQQKDHFVSTVSHEMRTPLTSIRSFSEILLKHGDSEPQVRREFLEIINKEAERLTRLVNNVLDLARIEAGEARLELAEFDVRAVVADAIASMQGMASEKKVAIRRELGDRKRPMCGDRDKIQQLVMNLVSNAIKFSPQAGDVEVEVGESLVAGRTEISVTDHGPGIAAEDLDRVFEKFSQAGGDVVSGVPSTGLGLAICREIAALHGGRVWAENEPSGGSRFRVELPGLDESRRSLAGGRAVPELAPISEPVPAAPAPRAGEKRSERRAPVEIPPDTRRRERDASDARNWSTTGSLPPLSPSVMKKARDDMSATGELPPIR